MNYKALVTVPSVKHINLLPVKHINLIDKELQW